MYKSWLALMDGICMGYPRVQYTLCLALVLTTIFPGIYREGNRDARRQGDSVGRHQVQSHGHRHRGSPASPWGLHTLLRCLPPAPTMNGTGYGKPSAPSQDPSPSPLKFPQASPTLSPDCSQQHSNIFRNYTCQFQTFLPIFCSPWHQSSLRKLYCPSPLSPRPPLKPPSHTLTKTKVMVPLQACFFSTQLECHAVETPSL